MTDTERAAWAAFEQGIVEDAAKELRFFQGWAAALVANRGRHSTFRDCPDCGGLGADAHQQVVFCTTCNGLGVQWR